MTALTFPNESNDYRAARNALLEAEIDLRSRVEDVAQMRRALPTGGEVREDYLFVEAGADGQTSDIRLSELFEQRDRSLFVYSFMFGPAMEAACPSCSSVLDALNGNAGHLRQRINLAVIARSPIERVSSFARDRGWNNLRVFSSANNNYNSDYYAETDSGAQMPMANVFSMQGGVIHHRWGTEMLYAGLDGHPRHVDFMWPLWNVLDTVPEGRGDWNPDLEV